MASRKLWRLSDKEWEEFLGVKAEVDAFDMDEQYGPYCHMKRTERLERARAMRLIGPGRYDRLKAIMTGEVTDNQEIARRLKIHAETEPSDSPNPVAGKPEYESYWI